MAVKAELGQIPGEGATDVDDQTRYRRASLVAYTVRCGGWLVV